MIGGPLGGEAFAAVDAQAVRRIEREDALLSAADADHHFEVRVDAPAGAFHDADEDGAVPRQLAIEIAKLALDEERLQPLPAGEVAQLVDLLRPARDAEAERTRVHRAKLSRSRPADGRVSPCAARRATPDA